MNREKREVKERDEGKIILIITIMYKKNLCKEQNGKRDLLSNRTSYELT